MPIQILNDSAYRGFLAEVDSPGIEASHIAHIAFQEGTIRAYIKVYPPRTNGLANEITGHLLAEALGLAVPARAAVLLIPAAAIPNPPPWVHEQPADAIAAWCTQDMAWPSIKFTYRLAPGADLAPIVAELRQSPATKEIIALDDWMANVDRNLGNLLRLAKGRYLLIDHGHCLSGRDWMPPDLADPATQFANKLRQLLGRYAESPDFRSQLADCCRLHADALAAIHPELAQWWGLLLDTTAQRAADRFLTARTIEATIRHRYGMLL